MNAENLKFKIGLSGTFYQKRPQYSILINNIETVSGTVTADSNEIFFVEFDYNFDENTTNKLQIRLENKTPFDTMVVNGDIIKDMLLNIESISIDSIDLGFLIWSKSIFKLDRPQKINDETITELANCVNLGWNGSYELEFTSPFYFWLLENF